LQKQLIGWILFISLLIGIPLVMLFIGQNNSHGTKIKVNKSVEVPWLEKSDKKVTLLFFGYVGCADVCAPILFDMQHTYRSSAWKGFTGEVEVVFINLTPQTEPSSVDSFAKSFDIDFKGVYLSRKELLKIERNFRLFFSTSIFDRENINHTDHIYLISNSKTDRTLHAIYPTHPLNRELLTEDIKNIMEYSY